MTTPTTLSGVARPTAHTTDLTAQSLVIALYMDHPVAAGLYVLIIRLWRITYSGPLIKHSGSDDYP